MSEAEYKSAVREARSTMLAGGLIVLSQRYEIGVPAPPFELYRNMENDFPFRTYIKGRACHLFSASPEILVVVNQRKVSSNSLSWFERTGNKKDMRVARFSKDVELKHKRILGQVARDIEKVAKPGSVYLVNIFVLEFFSLAVHLTCTAIGDLLDHLSCWDALHVVMPGAAASGFPKAEAIKLIDQLEPARRGPFGGGIGCISFFGDMEMAVALDLAVFPIGNRVYHMHVEEEIIIEGDL